MSSIYSKPVCDLAWAQVGYSQYDGKHTKYAADLPDDAISVSDALEKGIISQEELSELLFISDNILKITKKTGIISI